MVASPYFYGRAFLSLATVILAAVPVGTACRLLSLRDRPRNVGSHGYPLS